MRLNVSLTLTLPIGLAVFALACDQRRPDGTVGLPVEGPGARGSQADQPPVAINAVSPVTYPEALLEERIEGRVLLRLFADSAGTVVADSSRVAESSGYPALDSAALVAAPRLRFSPALHGGWPVAGPFIQPVQFRVPRGGA
ncbi:MAG: energy transducer TonB [Gemmatimonadales bacterium]|nr:energy transducer TonB [Gemmatimonadales bacterium]